MKKRNRVSEVGKIAMTDMNLPQCVAAPTVNHNEHAQRIAKLEGMLALMYDTWFEGCDQVRNLIGAEISKLRLGVRW